MQSPIFITGCARSGTSMVAGCINICGAFGGNMSGPTRNNRKGMFENHKIRQQTIKPYLRNIGVDHMGQYPLPDVKNIPVPVDLRQKIERIMKEQGYKGGPWMYKGAKMCLIWPVMHYAFPDAKWIIVRRRTGDILQSCLKTNFMRAFRRKEVQKAVRAKDEREGWLWWVHQHEQRWIEMITAGLNIKIVWPERMVSGDYSQMMETIEWLGLEWKTEVLSFIDPKLWHSREKKKNNIVSYSLTAKILEQQNEPANPAITQVN